MDIKHASKGGGIHDGSLSGSTFNHATDVQRQCKRGAECHI